MGPSDQKPGKKRVRRHSWGRKKKNSKKQRDATESFNSSQFAYKSTLTLHAKDKDQPIYAIKFNPFIKGRYIFAASILSGVGIFECVEDQNNNKYNNESDSDDTDSHVGKSESEEEKSMKRFKLIRLCGDQADFCYALEWTYIPENENDIAVVFGGKNGPIRVLSMNRDRPVGEIIGHSMAVNDLKRSPSNPILIASASADRSVRLWDVQTLACLIIFAGEIHHSQAISIDFNHDGSHIVSSGMDHAIAVWKVPDDVIEVARTTGTSQRLYEHEFATRVIHKHYIDSVIWYDDNVFFSRSCNGDIVMWKIGKETGNVDSAPDFRTKQTTVLSILRDHKVDETPIWFLRMTIDYQARFLVCGDLNNNLNIWDLDLSLPTSNTKCIVRYPKTSQTKCIYMCTFSLDGKILLACSGDGKIMRFDKSDDYTEVKMEID